MITVRRAEDRGNTKLNWLDSRHTFSFALAAGPHVLHKVYPRSRKWMQRRGRQRDESCG